MCAGLSRCLAYEEQVEAVLTELEAALGYGFAKPELLVCALTHRSLANQQIQKSAADATSAGQ